MVQAKIKRFTASLTRASGKSWIGLWRGLGPVRRELWSLLRDEGGQLRRERRGAAELQVRDIAAAVQEFAELLFVAEEGAAVDFAGDAGDFALVGVLPESPGPTERCVALRGGAGEVGDPDGIAVE